MIDIVIVNWNAGSQLKMCVESCINYGGGLVSSIIVVDNGSTDGSLCLIDGMNGVDLVRAGSNLGFGRACNLGAECCNSAFVLFLNPDAAIYPDTLKHTLDFMMSPCNGRVGICGIQLHDETGRVARSCARFPSVLGFTVHSLGMRMMFPKLCSAMTEWDHLSTREVDQVIGAFFFVRRALFEVLGGFDERFFVYFEEVDFARRAMSLGWTSMYLSDAQAFHSGGGTSNQVKAKRLFYSLSSRLLYAFKHFSALGAFCVLLGMLLLEPLSRSGLAIYRRSWTAMSETWAGYALLLRWLFTKPFFKLRG